MDEEQKKELEALQEKLIKAAKEVVKLKITTTVGDIETAIDDDGKKTFIIGDGSSTLHTEIDLLQGDIVSLVDKDLLADKYNPVRDLHEGREKRGDDIIRANMQTLTALAKTIGDFLNPPENGG
jgi:hypothetical protein